MYIIVLVSLFTTPHLIVSYIVIFHLGLQENEIQTIVRGSIAISQSHRRASHYSKTNKNMIP